MLKNFILILVLTIILFGCEKSIEVIKIPSTVEIKHIEKHYYGGSETRDLDIILKYFEYEGLEFIHVEDYLNYENTIRKVYYNRVDDRITIGDNDFYGSPLEMNISDSGIINYKYISYAKYYQSLIYNRTDFGIEDRLKISLHSTPVFYESSFLEDSAEMLQGEVTLELKDFGIEYETGLEGYLPLHLMSFLLFGPRYIQLEIDDNILFMNSVDTARFGADYEIIPDLPTRAKKMSKLEMIYNINFIKFLFVEVNNTPVYLDDIVVTTFMTEKGYYKLVEELMEKVVGGTYIKESELPIVDPSRVSHLFRFPDEDLVITNNGNYNYVKIDNFIDLNSQMIKDKISYALPSIIDLRGNIFGTGLNALYVLTIFNEEVKIEDSFKRTQYSVIFDGSNLNEYYVIVDETTSAGATVFAGFAQQYGATIIGSRTKGTFGLQSIINLSNGDAIVYDSGVVKYSSNGITFEDGVIPDIKTKIPELDIEELIEWVESILDT